VVHTSATVGATVGARVGAATACDAVVGSVGCKPGMGSRSQGVGYVDRPGLGAAVTAVLALGQLPLCAL
jgi:hypothetical protein